jgi:hypothetical protein
MALEVVCDEKVKPDYYSGNTVGQGHIIGEGNSGSGYMDGKGFGCGDLNTCGWESGVGGKHSRDNYNNLT